MLSVETSERLLTVTDILRIEGNLISLFSSTPFSVNESSLFTHKYRLHGVQYKSNYHFAFAKPVCSADEWFGRM